MATPQRRVPLRPFGAESRRELLDDYFGDIGELSVADAWVHVYRLLLWIDRTTGLAHCYESDKSQPGRPWYMRSLAFHVWLSDQLGVSADALAQELDWLFVRGTERLAAAAVEVHERRAELARGQREPYADRSLPLPGEDPGLEALMLRELQPWLAAAPPPDALRALGERIRLYLGQENRRRNLIGEGFEDTLAVIIRRLPDARDWSVPARPLLHDLPGFREPPGTEKPRRVDLALITPGTRRTLVTVKWSVRADREEQFGVDFEAYARLEAAGEDFDFTLVTNEFDAARLAAACERRRQNAPLFADVVHVNPEGVLAAYGDSLRGSARRLVDHVRSGRLSSLRDWLADLGAST